MLNKFSLPVLGEMQTKEYREYGHWCKVYYGKVEPLYRPKWPIGPALYFGFLSIKRLRVLLLLPGWDASPSQGYPQHICWYPFVHLGEEKHCESKVSCLRAQHNDHGQGSNPGPLDPELSAQTMRPLRLL